MGPFAPDSSHIAVHRYLHLVLALSAFFFLFLFFFSGAVDQNKGSTLSFPSGTTINDELAYWPLREHRR